MDELDVRRYGLLPRQGMAGMGEESLLSSLISGATGLFTASQQKKQAEAAAKAQAEVAKAQAATAAAQQSIAASKAAQAQAAAQPKATTTSALMKYLPWIAGGAVVLGAAFFLMRGRGSSDNQA
jgi:hypothetical protein